MTNEERETLMGIKKAAENGLSCISCGNDCISQLWQIVRLCDTILAASQCNCDINTAKEQDRGHDKFRGTAQDGMSKCQYYCEFAPSCVLSHPPWAQTPNEIRKGGVK